MIFLIITIIVLIFSLYKRYFPVLGVQYINLKDFYSKESYLNKIKVVDIRGFNESYKNPIEGAINIPTAYLKRNINEIPNSELHLVASNLLDKNMGTRYLRKKGFRVVGYTIDMPSFKEAAH